MHARGASPEPAARPCGQNQRWPERARRPAARKASQRTLGPLMRSGLELIAIDSQSHLHDGARTVKRALPSPAAASLPRRFATAARCEPAEARASLGSESPRAPTMEHRTRTTQGGTRRACASLEERAQRRSFVRTTQQRDAVHRHERPSTRERVTRADDVDHARARAASTQRDGTTTTPCSVVRCAPREPRRSHDTHTVTTPTLVEPGDDRARNRLDFALAATVTARERCLHVAYSTTFGSV
jgi:hypothetical protein